MSSIDYILNNQEKYFLLVVRHVYLTVSALCLCIMLGVAIGVLCFQNQRLTPVITGIAGGIRVVPSIAVMLILMPVMGTGFLSAVTALTIVGLPPVINNTALALTDLDPGILESAQACGMSNRRIFYKIRLPLALPMMITGVRISGLSVAAGASLAAYIGAGGLGELVLSGLSQYRMDMLVAGGISIVVISLFIEILFQLCYSFATKYKKRGI